MSDIYGKGPKGKATKLHSKIIRSLGYCQHCGESDYPLLQAAHIISRKYSATRTDLSNAFCLCARCHRLYTDFPVLFTEFIYEKIGKDKYQELHDKAQPTTKMDWDAELARLQAIALEQGVA